MPSLLSVMKSFAVASDHEEAWLSLTSVPQAIKLLYSSSC